MTHQRGNILVISLVVLLVVTIASAGGYFYWQQLRTNEAKPTEQTTLTSTPTPTDDFNDLANQFFLAAKNKNANSLYSFFSKNLQTEVDTTKTAALLNQLDLYGAAKQSQLDLKDITLILKAGQNTAPGKSYTGLITYSSPPNGTLEISFIKEGSAWKVVKFNFKRQFIANTGNLDNDLAKIKSNITFTLYKPSYLPNGYLYDGAVVLEITNQNIPDGKAHPMASMSFSNKNSRTQEGGSKGVYIAQVGYKALYQEILAFAKSKAGPKQTVQELSIQGGKAIYTQVWGQNSLAIVRADSVITILTDESISTPDLLKIANSLTEVK